MLKIDESVFGNLNPRTIRNEARLGTEKSLRGKLAKKRSKLVDLLN